MLQCISEFPYFLRLSNIPLYVFGLCIHPRMNMGYFHIVVIVNAAAVNMGIQISLQDFDFLFSNSLTRDQIKKKKEVSLG